MAKKQEYYVKYVEKEIFAALLTLGFNKQSFTVEEKAYINEKMFKKINQNVGEHILHFLFTRINPQVATKIFRDCWPTHDRKMKAQFQKQCFDWYKNLYQCGDYVLKPRSIVSRDIVNPSSDKGEKFLETVYTLCLIALQSRIKAMDIYSRVMNYPLCKDHSHRQKANEIILQCQQFHCDHYIQSTHARTPSLRSLSNHSKLLLGKYRQLVSQKNETRQKWTSLLETSTNLCSSDKENFLLITSQSFKQELQDRISSRNEEIRSLWENLDQLEHEDSICWPNVSSLIEGDNGFACLDGDALLQASGKAELSERCFTDNKLDLVGLFQSSIQPLKNIKGVAVQMKRLRVEQGGGDPQTELKSSENQLKCVKSLKENTKVIRSQLTEMLTPLTTSVLELRQGLEAKKETNLTSEYSDSFCLCPPMPSLSLQKIVKAHRRSKPPYQLISLYNFSNYTNVEKSILSELNSTRESSSKTNGSLGRTRIDTTKLSVHKGIGDTSNNTVEDSTYITPGIGGGYSQSKLINGKVKRCNTFVDSAVESSFSPCFHQTISESDELSKRESGFHSLLRSLDEIETAKQKLTRSHNDVTPHSKSTFSTSEQSTVESRLKVIQRKDAGLGNTDVMSTLCIDNFDLESTLAGDNFDVKSTLSQESFDVESSIFAPSKGNVPQALSDIMSSLESCLDDGDYLPFKSNDFVRA